MLARVDGYPSGVWFLLITFVMFGTGEGASEAVAERVPDAIAESADQEALAQPAAARDSQAAPVQPAADYDGQETLAPQVAKDSKEALAQSAAAKDSQEALAQPVAKDNKEALAQPVAKKAGNLLMHASRVCCETYAVFNHPSSTKKKDALAPSFETPQ